MKFLHVRIPTKEVKDREVYYEELKMYCTNPEEHPYSIQYFRYEESSLLPEKITTQAHIAYEVDSIEETLKEVEELLVKPFNLNGTIMAYVIKDSLIMELRQIETK